MSIKQSINITVWLLIIGVIFSQDPSKFKLDKFSDCLKGSYTQFNFTKNQGFIPPENPNSTDE